MTRRRDSKHARVRTAIGRPADRIGSLAAVLVSGALLFACSADGPKQNQVTSPGTTGAGGAGEEEDPDLVGGTDGGTTTTKDSGGVKVKDRDKPQVECSKTTITADNKFAPVDIIMAIDNSGSMVNESVEVQNNMIAFADFISKAGIDLHFILISRGGPPGPFTPGVCIPAPVGNGTCPDDTNLPGFLHLLYEVASTDALSLILKYYPEYKASLRPNALKYITVITDDNSATDAKTFSDGVTKLDPGPPDMFAGWRFFAVYCLGPCPALLACAKTGDVYTELITQTGGVGGDLCAGQTNFAAALTPLAQSVVESTTAECSWDIPAPPPGETFDPARVNVTYTPKAGGPPEDLLYAAEPKDCGDNQGWFYNTNPEKEAPTLILPCPKTCERFQADLGQVDVVLGCPTAVLPVK